MVLMNMMTPEKRLEMQMFRNQACIADVRIKTRNREREFLNRVQKSLESIQRDHSEKELSNTNRHLADSAALDQDNPTHISKGIHDENSRITQKAELYSNQTNSPAAETPQSAIVTVAKIHRRRLESEGSTDSEMSQTAEQSRQRTWSNRSVTSEPPADTAHGEGISPVTATVRRTSSEKRIRRTGSERSAKLADTDKGMRRAGSTDIPSAIQSESDPKKVGHRRHGSGDMISLVSKRSSELNYLTRSYDMSIRSLCEGLKDSMSAADSVVKEKESWMDSKDQPVADADTAQTTLENKVLSPKYFSSSHTKEASKILGRSGYQKKSPSSKEAGPPQPIKAIHSLPSSLGPSRESTFDSLPVNAPYFPDLEPTYGVTYACLSKEPEAAPYNQMYNVEHALHTQVNTPGGEPLLLSKSGQSNEVFLAETNRLVVDPALEKEKGVEGLQLKPSNKQTDVWPVLLGSLDNPGEFLKLPNKISVLSDQSLPICGQQYTQQWLIDKISQLHCTGEVDIHNWLQNAPDSVKQKLPHIFKQSACDSKTAVITDMTTSLDDTLRSTSPLPVNEQAPVSPSQHSESGSELSSPGSQKSSSVLLIRSNSYTLEKPSPVLLMQKSSPQCFPHQIELPQPEISQSTPFIHNRVEVNRKTHVESDTAQDMFTQSSSKTDISPNAIERNKAIASKSYTVEKPSAVLLDSLSEVQKSAIETKTTGSAVEVSSHTSSPCDSVSQPDNTNKRSVQRKLNYSNVGHMSPGDVCSKPNAICPERPERRSMENQTRFHVKKYLEHLIQQKIITPTIIGQESTTTGLSIQDMSNAPQLHIHKPQNKKPGKPSHPTDIQAANKKNVINQVKNDLRLLKTKYAKKFSPTESESSKRSQADISVGEIRPVTAMARLQSNTISTTPASIKSFAEKEATPITTGYSSTASFNKSFESFNFYGGIHSVSHSRPPTAVSPRSESDEVKSDVEVDSGEVKPGSSRLAALIKGHLCRKLLHTYKVQSIIKTIKDCQSLLTNHPAQKQANMSHSIQDLNFQERLLDQWEAALEDIHNIFFELSKERQIALIRQSEVPEGQIRLHKPKSKVMRSSFKAEHMHHKKVSLSTSNKYLDKKKAQKVAADAAGKTNATDSTVFMKKAIIAPKFAANSPKKAVQVLNGRVSKDRLRVSPKHRSSESLRSANI